MMAIDDEGLSDEQRELMYRYILKVIKQDRARPRPRNRMQHREEAVSRFSS
jgi:hypothetical protein